MTIPRMTVLVVGATGSIGSLVIEEAVRRGHAVRALVRTPRQGPPASLSSNRPSQTVLPYAFLTPARSRAAK